MIHVNQLLGDYIMERRTAVAIFREPFPAIFITALA